MITEGPLTLDVSAGVALEASLALPVGATAGVVICHPHPLYGGDMDNPRVLDVMDACHHAGLGTLRFNFRGTGRSTGRHDDGRGERDDVRAALAALRERLPATGAVALAGYSFGAAVAVAVAASGEALGGLALLAPPLVAGAYRSGGTLTAVSGPVLVVAGTMDEYCPVSALEELRAQWPKAEVRIIEGADHFFAGRGAPLIEALRAWAAAVPPGRA
ncbi:MAG TPA: alpha/beta fold hydrolase [Candidatus Limnocylindria bacterium]|nr:alpha/beta fold hydrolase [Candidatus Limnocylindria bacterium]